MGIMEMETTVILRVIIGFRGLGMRLLKLYPK